MKMKTATNRADTFKDELLRVWEASVRATHHFLADADIESLKPIVQQAFTEVSDLLYCIDEKEKILGFMGVDDGKIEMLFIHPAYRGCGTGRMFITYAINFLNASFVDVNEQNVQGVGFYKHMGFRTISRSPLDAHGNPFPIIHMSK